MLPALQSADRCILGREPIRIPDAATLEMIKQHLGVSMSGAGKGRKEGNCGETGVQSRDANVGSESR